MPYPIDILHRIPNPIIICRNCIQKMQYKAINSTYNMLLCCPLWPLCIFSLDIVYCDLIAESLISLKALMIDLYIFDLRLQEGNTCLRFNTCGNFLINLLFYCVCVFVFYCCWFNWWNWRRKFMNEDKYRIVVLRFVCKVSLTLSLRVTPYGKVKTYYM